MSVFQALVLGIVQGITEFLPVSSSGHLVLAESWFGLQVEHLLPFDVVLHAGTLVALVVYFWRDLAKMAVSLWYDLRQIILKDDAKQRLRDPDNPREQVWFLIVATLPVVFVGPLVKDVLEQFFRSTDMVVAMLGITALFLALAEKVGKRTLARVDSVKVALAMGVFQVFAMIPGVSRSGSTIVGGLFGGLKRQAAARFSFLMAVPAIGGATVFLLKDMMEMNGQSVGLVPMLVGFGSSMLVSFICMWGMLQFLRKRSLWVFVAYLTILVLAYVFLR